MKLRLLFLVLVFFVSEPVQAQFGPCLPNPCTSPPPNQCAGDTLTQFQSVGNCIDYGGGSFSCNYFSTQSSCPNQGRICLNGQCALNACDPNPCSAPPSDYCEGNTLIQHSAPGACTDLGGSSFSCSYPSQSIDCQQEGFICSAGQCANQPTVPSSSEIGLGLLAGLILTAGLYALYRDRASLSTR